MSYFLIVTGPLIFYIDTDSTLFNGNIYNDGIIPESV